MRMGQGVRTGLGQVGITCVLQTQFSNFFFKFASFLYVIKKLEQFRKFNTELVNLYTYIVVEKTSLFSKKKKFKFQEPLNL